VTFRVLENGKKQSDPSDSRVCLEGLHSLPVTTVGFWTRKKKVTTRFDLIQFETYSIAYVYASTNYLFVESNPGGKNSGMIHKDLRDDIH